MRTVTLTKVAGDPLSDQHIGYWVSGELIKEPETGSHLAMLRNVRNGEEVPGLFITSKIESLVPLDPWKTLVITQNSTWLMEEV